MSYKNKRLSSWLYTIFTYTLFKQNQSVNSMLIDIKPKKAMITTQSSSINLVPAATSIDTTTTSIAVNTTQPLTHEAFDMPVLLYITIICLYIFMILTIVLNLLSIICIVHAKAFTPINLLIMNLSISDIIYSTNVPVFAAQFIAKSITYPLIMCRLSFLSDVLTMMVNVYTIAALTLERYFCLSDNKKPFNDKIKTLIIFLSMVLLWLIAFIFALPKTLSIVIQIDSGQCASDWSDHVNKIYFLIKLVLFFGLPYAIIIIFSINILIFLKKWAKKANKLTSFKSKTNEIKGISKRCDKKVKNNTNLDNSPINTSSSPLKTVPTTTTLAVTNTATFKSSQLDIRHPGLVNTALQTRTTMIKRRTTRFVLAVVISYLITWSPLWTLQIYDTFSTTQTVYIMIINNIVLLLNYSNGVINPLLFMLLTQNFREYFTLLLHNIRRMLHVANLNQELKRNNVNNKQLSLSPVQKKIQIDDDTLNKANSYYSSIAQDESKISNNEKTHLSEHRLSLSPKDTINKVNGSLMNFMLESKDNSQVQPNDTITVKSSPNKTPTSFVVLNNPHLNNHKETRSKTITILKKHGKNDNKTKLVFKVELNHFLKSISIKKGKAKYNSFKNSKKNVNVKTDENDEVDNNQNNIFNENADFLDKQTDI